MNKITQLNKVLYVLIFTVATMLVFVVNINQQDISFYSQSSPTYQFFLELYLSVQNFDIIYVTLGIFIYYTYYHIYFDGKKLTKESFINSAIAVLLTFIIIIGKSYKVDNTLGTIFNTKAQIVKCIFLGIGYYFMFYALLKKICQLKLEHIKSKKKNKIWEKITKVIDKYQIIFAIVIILLGWLPYIIFYFPGASTGDTFDSLSQFFHQDNSWSIKTVNLLNEDVYINKHHPPFFTVILGLIFKLGKQLGSFTIGAFIYTILQVLLLLSIFSIMLHYMKKKKVPLWIRVASIFFIALTPTISAYAITAIKDTPSAIFTLLYIIFLVQIVKDYNSIFKSKWKIILLIITMILVMMLRNNGIFTIILSFPFFLIIYKKYWKKITSVLIVCLAIFGLYDKVLLPYCDVTDGSIKETLSIPFMQLARVVHFHYEDFSEEEQEKINKVLNFKSMKLDYYPDLADSVKDTYNKDTTEEELKEFFEIWWKYFKKYPMVYIESVLNSTYGYFFPEVGEEYATLAVDSRVGPNTFINIHSLKKYDENRKISYAINRTIAKLPFTSLFTHVAFYDWFLIFSCFYIIKTKKYKYLIPLAPLLSVLLVCLASPVNGSFRYILPIVFATPMILTIDYFAYKEKGNYKL